MTANWPGGPAADGAPSYGQIFVLGRNRSGTKWLTNQLSNHPEVAAITGPETGVLEANLFEHLPKMFGDLGISDHYYAFLACFAKSSYFLRTGLPESVLFERRHESYLEVFRFLMERLAESRGASAWLQKGNSLMLPALQAEFPNARFLIMRRSNVVDNVRSSIALNAGQTAGRRMPAVIARELASYYLHRGIEEEFIGRANVHLVTYEAMVGGKERVLREVSDFVGLDFDPVMLEDAYPRNTSYKKAKRADVLTGADLRTFEVLEPVIRAMPVSVLRRLYQGGVRPDPRPGERVLMPGSFKVFRTQVEQAAGAARGADDPVAETPGAGDLGEELAAG